MTLILNSNEIKHCVQFNKDLIPIIEDAFKSLSLGKTVMPPILRVDIEKYHGESDVKAAYVEGLDSFAVKVASGFFNNSKLGLPSSNGLMILLDSQTGIIKDSLMVTNTNLIAEMQQGLNLKQDKPVIAICRSGQRSMQVAKYLQAQGIEAINLKGGIVDWLNNQFEVEQI